MRIVHPRDRRPSLVAIAPTLLIVGGLLLAVKGITLALGGPDLTLVPLMAIVFSAGIVATSWPRRSDSKTSRVALVAGSVALAAGVVAGGGQIAGTGFDDQGAPGAVVWAHLLLGGGIFVGLIALGLAVRATGAGPWCSVPLVAGLLWFPAGGLTLVAPDGWGMVVGGLLWAGAGASVRVHAAVGSEDAQQTAEPLRRRDDPARREGPATAGRQRRRRPPAGASTAG